MTNNANEALAAAPCPFCAEALTLCADKDGEFWMHPGTVTDGECFMSGQGIFPRNLGLWNRRTPAAVVKQDLTGEAREKLKRQLWEAEAQRDRSRNAMDASTFTGRQRTERCHQEVKRLRQALASGQIETGV